MHMVVRVIEQKSGVCYGRPRFRFASTLSSNSDAESGSDEVPPTRCVGLPFVCSPMSLLAVYYT